MRILAKGIETLEQELEVDRFIKTQLKMKAAFRTLFSGIERFLLRNNRVFVLHTSTEEDSSSSEDS